MCGITGILSLGPAIRPLDIAEAEQMTAVLAHRGPDDRSLYQDDRCILGNTRLKTTDLRDHGRLPMCSQDGSVWIAYNGAVTNWRELKTTFDLANKYHFRSSSEAEVLICLYQDLGIEFIYHLSGMFAFCLYDIRKRKAYLVRDFYGLRPLFYMVKNSRFYFASEIKSFLEVGGFDKTLDLEGIYHFLSLAYLPGKHTPFADVRELEGGHLFEVDLTAGSYCERKYYDLRYVPDPALREQDAAKQLYALLWDSVRRNLIADVPVGLTLSGGVDTGSLLALAKDMGVSRKLHTFSIRIAEPSFDETRYQRILVDFAKPIHHEIVVKPGNVLAHLHAHMAYLDEPSGDGAAIPLHLLSREAKQYVKVLLSGEGGDEIFNAYETHRAYKMRKFYRRFVTPALRGTLRSLAHRLPASYSKLSFDFIAKRFTDGAELSVPEAHFFWRHVLSDDEKSRLIVKPNGFLPTSRLFTTMFAQLDFDDELNRISRIDLKYYFIDDLMVKNDRMLMANSIEGRYPYMDRKLVEYVPRIPTHLKIKGLQGRYIQKRAMSGRLPREIYRRSNMGLEMPHSLWFLREFRSVAEKYFSRKNIERSGLLEPAAVETLWKEHLAHEKDNGRPLWCILNFLIWFDLFVYESNYKRYFL